MGWLWGTRVTGLEAQSLTKIDFRRSDPAVSFAARSRQVSFHSDSEKMKTGFIIGGGRGRDTDFWVKN